MAGSIKVVNDGAGGGAGALTGSSSRGSEQPTPSKPNARRDVERRFGCFIGRMIDEV